MKTSQTKDMLRTSTTLTDAQSKALYEANKAQHSRELPSAMLESVGWHKGYKAGKAHSDKLAEALRGLFTHCAMVHKYWGENCNQAEADAAIANATKAQHEYELAQ